VIPGLGALAVFVAVELLVDGDNDAKDRAIGLPTLRATSRLEYHPDDAPRLVIA
jgi:hypothetical protein